MSSEARFIREHVLRGEGTLERNQHPRDNYKRLPKARISDSAALFSSSPENPTVSKEMVAHKTEKKYRRTIYRIITAHRNPMMRDYSKRERHSFFQHVRRYAEGIFGKMVAIITSLKKQSCAFITQLFLRYDYF